MINFIKNFFNKLKTKSLGYKFVVGLILVFYISIIAFSFIKTDKRLLTPGSISKVDNVIKIDSEYQAGDIYTVSVHEARRINYLKYLIAKLENSVNIATIPEQAMNEKDESIKGLIFKQWSINASLIVAYNEAAKVNQDVHIETNFLGFVVCGRDENVDKKLQLEDIITHVNGIEVKPDDNLGNLINATPAGQKIKFKVLRDGKIDGRIDDNATKLKAYEIEIPHVNFNLSILPFYDIDEEKTEPKFTIKNNNAQGPSGGLMQTISIYNSLVKTDITKGKIIMGTGTINLDGKVIEIGGVEQKVITANLYSAEIFIVPKGNYQDALAQYKKLKNSKFKLVSVETFSEVLEYLEGIE